MIILPALPAIVAALTPIAKTMLISAGIGAAVSGAACGIGGAVGGYQEHGELNRDVAINTAHQAAECAGEGALVGGLVGVAAPVVFPAVVAPGFVHVVPAAIAPAIQIVDDVARPVMQAADDAVRPVAQAIDDVARPATQAVDDAISPATDKVGNGAKSFGHAIASPWNRALNAFRARIYKRLPITEVGADDGWVYVMEDTTTGIRKIGHTSNPEQRLKGVQSTVGHKNVRYTCIIHSGDNKGLERFLHKRFEHQKLPNTGEGTEWFALSAAQVATACSH